MSQISSVPSSSSGGAHPIKNIITDSGTATPSSGVVNILSSANITVSENSNNATIALNDDITVDSALIGTVQFAGNDIYISDSGAGDVDLILDPNAYVTLNYGTSISYLYTQSGREVVSTDAVTDGQLLIGATGAAPQANTITAGSGISVVNSAGEITISSKGVAGGLLAWEIVTYTGRTGEDQVVVMEANKGYLGNGQAATQEQQGTSFAATSYPLVLQLPPSDSVSLGDMNVVVSMGLGGCQVQPQPDQQVYVSTYPNIGYNPVFVFPSGTTFAEYPSYLAPGGGRGAQPVPPAQSIAFVNVGTDVPGFPAGKNIWMVLYLSRLWIYTGSFREGPIGDGE